MPFDVQNRSERSKRHSMSTLTQTQDRRALSIREAARTCGLSRATMYRLIADGRLHTLKIGSRRLVTVGALDALLSESSK
jgi:excisionase family DNA binding protein